MAYPEGPKAKKDPPPRVDLGMRSLERSREEWRKEVQIATWLDSTPEGGVRPFRRARLAQGNQAKLKEDHRGIAQPLDEIFLYNVAKCLVVNNSKPS